MMKTQLKNFIEQIGKDAIAIIPAAHETTRSYDTEFKFHQDPGFLLSDRLSRTRRDCRD